MAENKYIAKQLSGPIANAVDSAAASLFAVADPEIAFMAGLSIDTANEATLKYIGQIIGYPWPVAPTGTFADNMFTFIEAAYDPTVNQQKGFGGVNVTYGGLFTTTDESEFVNMPIDKYRTLLKLVAKVKANGGLSLTIVDEIISTYTLNYALSWASNGDLTATFTPALDTGSLWTLTDIFNTLCIDFQVIFVQA